MNDDDYLTWRTNLNGKYFRFLDGTVIKVLARSSSNPDYLFVFHLVSEETAWLTEDAVLRGEEIDELAVLAAMAE